MTPRPSAQRSGSSLCKPGPARLEQAPADAAHTHTVVVGGVPGWQIARSAAAAALPATALAVIASGCLAGRPRVTASAA